MKAKLVMGNDILELEKNMNEFLSTENVFHIEYASDIQKGPGYGEGGFGEGPYGGANMAVLIVYSEH